MSEAAWQVVVVGLCLLVAAQSVLLVALMRQVGRVLLRIGPARVGELDEGPSVGEILEIPDNTGRAAIVLFISPGCAPCEALIPSLAAFSAAYADVDMTVAVTGADGERTSEVARRVGSRATTEFAELFRAWRIPGTPFAVALAESGRVRATGVVNTLEQLEVMAAAATEPPNLHEPNPQSNGRSHVDATVGS